MIDRSRFRLYKPQRSSQVGFKDYSWRRFLGQDLVKLGNATTHGQSQCRDVPLIAGEEREEEI